MIQRRQSFDPKRPALLRRRQLLSEPIMGYDRRSSGRGNQPFAAGPLRSEHAQRPVVPEDGKPILLLGGNGVNFFHQSMKGSSGYLKLRPHAQMLFELQDYFHVGMYTSCTWRTLNTMVALMNRELGDKLVTNETLLLHRSHTSPAPPDHVLHGGNSWDTVKPIGKWFDRTRVILVDDEEYKALDDERVNMIVIPPWDRTKTGDEALKVLVEELLAAAKEWPEGADVREHTEAIEAALRRGLGLDRDAQADELLGALRGL